MYLGNYKNIHEECRGAITSIYIVIVGGRKGTVSKLAVDDLKVGRNVKINAEKL